MGGPSFGSRDALWLCLVPRTLLKNMKWLRESRALTLLLRIILKLNFREIKAPWKKRAGRKSSRREIYASVKFNWANPPG